jgi:hypothetical protein
LSGRFCGIFAAASCGWITQLMILWLAVDDPGYLSRAAPALVWAMVAAAPAGLVAGLIWGRRLRGFAGHAAWFALLGAGAGAIATVAMATYVGRRFEAWRLAIPAIGTLICFASAGAIVGAARRQSSGFQAATAAEDGEVRA